MKETNDFDEENRNVPLIYMILGVSVFILVLAGIVIALNGGGKKKQKNDAASLTETSQTQETEEEDSTGTDWDGRKGNLTADDLDIWDMYPETTQDETETEEKKKDDKDKEETQTSTENTLDDGKHVKITYRDGSTEWVAINPYWEKNTYDFTNLVSNDGKLRYYSDGNKVSFLGADISRYQDDIDFAAMKEDGIDFVMIRLGSRGYQTGALQLDEDFTKNIEGATLAGLSVGIYFYSQAVTQQEAEEEANLVIENLKDKKITYPVAFDMEFADNDSSRVETLSKDERTVIAASFLKKIKEAGYIPMIYGNMEWLLKRIDLSKLTDYSVWLSDESDIPAYPYQFQMWQYTKQGEVAGIDGYVDLNINFVDYSAR